VKAPATLIAEQAMADGTRYDLSQLAPLHKLTLRAINAAMDELDHSIETLEARKQQLRADMESILRHMLEKTGQTVKPFSIAAIDWHDETVDCLSPEATKKVMQSMEDHNG